LKDVILPNDIVLTMGAGNVGAASLSLKSELEAILKTNKVSIDK